jgi:hypothetical protein
MKALLVQHEGAGARPLLIGRSDAVGVLADAG